MLGSIKSNYLQKYRYLDTSVLSTIINLKKDLNEIWSNARKRIKRAINSMENMLKINFYTYKNISDEIFDAYQKMHLKAAGRKTRPEFTWNLMKNWITQNKAILVSAELNKEEIGFAIFILYKQNAYYASGANDPNKADLPIAHYLFWRVIKWLKQNLFNYFEIGVFSYPSFFTIPSEKENQISFFKQGFGGKIYPVYQEEK